MASSMQHGHPQQRGAPASVLSESITCKSACAIRNPRPCALPQHHRALAPASSSTSSQLPAPACSFSHGSPDHYSASASAS